MNTEIWKDVVGYEGLYKVSNMGNVFDILKDRQLKIGGNKDHYKIVGLYKNGAKKSFPAHRIVATAFIDGDKTTYVNHKNLIKSDNRAENLEWCTVKENIIHARSNKYKPLLPKLPDNIDEKEYNIGEWLKVSDYARKYNMSVGAVLSRINGNKLLRKMVNNMIHVRIDYANQVHEVSSKKWS